MGKNRKMTTTNATAPAPTEGALKEEQQQQDQTSGTDTGAKDEGSSIAGASLTPLATGEQTPAEQQAPAPIAPLPVAPVIEQPAQAPAPAPEPAPAKPEPTPVTTPSTSHVVENKKVVVVEGDTPAAGLVKAIIDKASAKASPTGKIVLAQIGDYMENMKPKKPITVTDGARHQVTLYRALTKAINTLDDDFALVFTTILRLFNDHSNAVFHESYVYRFMESVSLPVEERKAFARLLNLIITTADVKTRQHGLKFVDFNKSLEFGVTDKGRTNLLTYFNK